MVKRMVFWGIEKRDLRSNLVGVSPECCLSRYTAQLQDETVVDQRLQAFQHQRILQLLEGRSGLIAHGDLPVME